MKTKLLSKEPRSTALVLEPGDEVVAAIEDWARKEGIRAASVTAIGGFESCLLGFFEWESKEYAPIPVNEQAEVVSLIGDIAMAEGDEVKLHAHVVLGCRDGSCRAGHLMSGDVRPTLEVVVNSAPAHLRRKMDPASGLPLIEP